MPCPIHSTVTLVRWPPLSVVCNYAVLFHPRYRQFATGSFPNSNRTRQRIIIYIIIAAAIGLIAGLLL